MTTTTKLPPGVYIDKRNGTLRAVAKVGRAKEDRKEKTFPAGTARKTITDWQRDTCTELAKRDKPKIGSLIAELPLYLTRRRTMGKPMSEKQLAQREGELRRLFAVLGPNRTRADIGYEQIVDALVKLKTAGRSGARTRITKDGREVKAGGRVAKQLSNGSIRCYKNALQNFYTILGGRSASNPVKDVTKNMFPEPKRRPAPKISYALLHQILDAMADVGGPAVKGQRRSEINLTRIRLKLIAYCGLPPQQIRELEPDDIDWENRTVIVGRNKGAGLDAEAREMGDYGMDVLREFADAKAFTQDAPGKVPFTSSSMYKSFCRARDKVAPGSTVTPLKLRHLFANAALDAGADEKSASRINLHGSEATSRIYRETGERKRDRETWNKIDRLHRRAGRTLKYPDKVLDNGVGRTLKFGRK